MRYFAFLIAVVVSTLPAMASPFLPQTQVWVISNAEQECTIEKDFANGTLYIHNIKDKVTGDVIDMSYSPLWRLDFRPSELLGNPSKGNAAEWLLIPSLDPRKNGDRFGSGASTIPVTTDLSSPRSGSVSASVSAGLDSATLNWTGLKVGDFYSQIPIRTSALDAYAQNTTFDVVVNLIYPPTGGLEGTIEVRIYKPNGGHNGEGVVLLSTAFPDVMIKNIGGGGKDDLLLVPFQHGFLFGEPNKTFQQNLGQNWKDHFLYDFGKYFDGSGALLSGGTGGRHLLFPAAMSSQFLYLYDLKEEIDGEPLADPFITHTQEGKFTGMGKQPSLRGGGQGLFLSTEDPDLNLKSVFFDGEKDEEGQPILRLGIRTLVEFQSEFDAGIYLSRIEELKQSNNSTSPQLWQVFGIGTSPTQPSSATIQDINFSTWNVKISTMEGDWFDAAQVYREQFLEDSIALERDALGSPIKLKDLPDNGPNMVVPAEHKWDAFMLGLLEPPDNPGTTSPGKLDGRWIDMPEQLAAIRAHINFFREGWSAFYPVGALTPMISVVHGHGMTANESPPTISTEVHKSGGVENMNYSVRNKIPLLYDKLRNEDVFALPPWEGRVMTFQNRDTGNYHEEDPLKFPLNPDIPIVRRASGVEAFRKDIASTPDDELLSSYASGENPPLPPNGRADGPSNLQALLKDSFESFIRPNGGSSQLDWYTTSGQMSSFKPDYSVSSTYAHRGIGGGNQWALNVKEMRDDLINFSSPPLSWTNMGTSKIITGTERFNEGVLQNNIPSGHRQSFPVSAREFDGTPQLACMLGEPLSLTTVLYHDYSLMMTPPITFSLYYGLVYPEQSPGLASSKLLDQRDPQQRKAGRQFTLMRLAKFILQDGLQTGLGINVNPTKVMDIDANSDNFFDPQTDYLAQTFSGKATGGGFDRIDPSTGLPPSGDPYHARKILRARMRLIDFLSCGQSLRYPELEAAVGSLTQFFADGVLVRRFEDLQNPNPNLNSNPLATYTGVDLSTPNIVMGAWAVDHDVFLDTDPINPAKRVKVVVPMFNVADHNVEYSLVLPLEEWDITTAHTLKCFVIQNGQWIDHPGFQDVPVTPGMTTVTIPNMTIGGPNPTMTAKELQVWLLEY